MDIVFKYNTQSQKISEYGKAVAVYKKKAENGTIYTSVIFEDSKGNLGLIEYVCNPKTAWGQTLTVEVNENAYAETPLFRQLPSFRFFRVPTRLAQRWDAGGILAEEEIDALIRSGYINQINPGECILKDRRDN